MTYKDFFPCDRAVSSEDKLQRVLTCVNFATNKFRTSATCVFKPSCCVTARCLHVIFVLSRVSQIIVTMEDEKENEYVLLLDSGSLDHERVVKRLC